ncbi:hypothetical protein ICM05_09710 [Leucobacter sp. cx-42]|uniref:hypothetical protein n=1 Tax=unclassified Leucobacter TaxID=2621730 RepID=UPI00165E2027|nr:MULTISPECIES: hypothetical protein [unclassified Leucobacter]MBC9954913.1 hypothetical protein [Leucobacter sp. cx-42]
MPASWNNATPWRDAELGDVWALDVDYIPVAAWTVVGRSGQLFFYEPVNQLYISLGGVIAAGQKIWPFPAAPTSSPTGGDTNINKPA